MQNAGQYVPGAASAHQPQQFVPSEPSPNGGSTTSSLRQFRKKDVEKSHPEPHKQVSESHVARVAPHNHYPPVSSDCYRYTQHQYQDYGHPVKYSDIAETPQPNPISTSVIQKSKPKDYMEMCNVQQTHMKPTYPDHLNSHQNYSSENSQYMHKDPTQIHPTGYKPESQFFSKDHNQYQQISHHPVQKFNPMLPQNMRKYAPTENPFLTKLSKLHPSMARSIMSDHHLQDAQTTYSSMDQRGMYQQNQRYYPGSLQPNPYAPNNYPMNNPHYSNYPPASCSFPRPIQMQSVGPRYSHMERSLSPARRPFPDNMHMPMNYHGMSQKMPHNYPQYNAPEYAQHYQHRRMTQEYYQQHCRPVQYLQNHQMQAQEMHEITESRVSPSDSLKKFIENWDADEEPSNEINSLDNNINIKENIRTREEPQVGTVYMINATDVQYFENNGIPLVASDNGISLTQENYQYLLKNGVNFENSGMLKIIDANKEISVESNGNQERVVNLHIMDSSKPDCMMANKTVLSREANMIQNGIPKRNEENKRIVIHENTVINVGNSNVNRENAACDRIPLMTHNIDQIPLHQPEVKSVGVTKELVDKNCSPINLDQLENNIGFSGLEIPQTNTTDIPKCDSADLSEAQLGVLATENDEEENIHQPQDSPTKSPGAFKNMPIIDIFGETSGADIETHDKKENEDNVCSTDIVKEENKQSKAVKVHQNDTTPIDEVYIPADGVNNLDECCVMKEDNNTSKTNNNPGICDDKLVDKITFSEKQSALLENIFKKKCPTVNEEIKDLQTIVEPEQTSVIVRQDYVQVEEADSKQREDPMLFDLIAQKCDEKDSICKILSDKHDKEFQTVNSGEINASFVNHPNKIEIQVKEKQVEANIAITYQIPEACLAPTTTTERRKRMFSVDDIIHHIGNNMTKRYSNDFDQLCSINKLQTFIEKEMEFSSSEQICDIIKHSENHDNKAIKEGDADLLNNKIKEETKHDDQLTSTDGKGLPMDILPEFSITEFKVVSDNSQESQEEAKDCNVVDKHLYEEVNIEYVKKDKFKDNLIENKEVIIKLEDSEVTNLTDNKTTGHNEGEETKISKENKIIELDQREGIQEKEIDQVKNLVSFSPKVEELEERSFTPSEVQYRNAIRVEENSVLLQIAGEFMEITVSLVNGKKVITVVPLSDSTVVDYNDNYDVTANDELLDSGQIEESVSKETIDIEKNSSTRQELVITGVEKVPEESPVANGIEKKSFSEIIINENNNTPEEICNNKERFNSQVMENELNTISLVEKAKYKIAIETDNHGTISDTSTKSEVPTDLKYQNTIESRTATNSKVFTETDAQNVVGKTTKNAKIATDFEDHNAIENEARTNYENNTELNYNLILNKTASNPQYVTGIDNHNNAIENKAANSKNVTELNENTIQNETASNLENFTGFENHNNAIKNKAATNSENVPELKDNTIQNKTASHPENLTEMDNHNNVIENKVATNFENDTELNDNTIQNETASNPENLTEIDNHNNAIENKDAANSENDTEINGNIIQSNTASNPENFTGKDNHYNVIENKVATNSENDTELNDNTIQNEIASNPENLTEIDNHNNFIENKVAANSENYTELNGNIIQNKTASNPENFNGKDSHSNMIENKAANNSGNVAQLNDHNIIQNKIVSNPENFTGMDNHNVIENKATANTECVTEIVYQNVTKNKTTNNHDMDNHNIKSEITNLEVTTQTNDFNIIESENVIKPDIIKPNKTTEYSVEEFITIDSCHEVIVADPLEGIELVEEVAKANESFDIPLDGVVTTTQILEEDIGDYVSDNLKEEINDYNKNISEKRENDETNNNANSVKVECTDLNNLKINQSPLTSFLTCESSNNDIPKSKTREQTETVSFLKSAHIGRILEKDGPESTTEEKSVITEEKNEDFELEKKITKERKKLEVVILSPTSTNTDDRIDNSGKCGTNQVYLEPNQSFRSDSYIKDSTILTISTKAAKKLYECDLQIPAVTTSGYMSKKVNTNPTKHQCDTVTSSKKESDPKEVTKIKKSKRYKNEKAKANSEHREKLKKLVDKKKQKSETNQEETEKSLNSKLEEENCISEKEAKEVDDEYVDFKELLRARKVRKLKKLQEIKEKEAKSKELNANKELKARKIKSKEVKARELNDNIVKAKEVKSGEDKHDQISKMIVKNYISVHSKISTEMTKSVEVTSSYAKAKKSGKKSSSCVECCDSPKIGKCIEDTKKPLEKCRSPFKIKAEKKISTINEEKCAEKISFNSEDIKKTIQETTDNTEQKEPKLNLKNETKREETTNQGNPKFEKRARFCDETPSSTSGVTKNVNKIAVKPPIIQNTLKDPRKRLKKISGQIIVPSVSELIEENGVASSKKKITLADYNSRKRKLSSDSNKSEIVAEKIELKEKKSRRDIAVDRESIQSVGEKSDECSSKRSLSMRPSFIIHTSDWEETQSPKQNFNQIPKEECLIQDFSGLISNSKKPVIDINELNPPFENPKDIKLQEYKDKVDSKLSSLNIQIPKVKPQVVLDSKSKLSLGPYGSPETSALVKRFLNNEKMSQDEMEKIKKIISYKRMIQHQKIVKSPEMSSSSANLSYEMKSLLRLEDMKSREMKLHLKKVNAKRKSHPETDEEDSGSIYSDQSEVSSRQKRNVDYSVYNRLGKDGLPKIIFKRKKQNEVAECPKPVVLLERLELDRVGEKYNVTVSGL